MHAMRTRVNTASASLDSEKDKKGKEKKTEELPVNTADAIPAPPTAADVPAPAGATNRKEDSSGPSAGTSTTVVSRESSVSPVDGGKDGKVAAKKDGDAGTAKQASAQAGSISNLITVDANNLDAFLEITARESLLSYNMSGQS